MDEPRSTLFDSEFRRQARKWLHPTLYNALHKKAFSAAGGRSPRKPKAEEQADPVDAIAKRALAMVEAGDVRVRLTKQRDIPIIEADKTKQVVLCVALEPDVPDFHNDVVDAEEIEKVAHDFMRRSRVIKRQHSEQIAAYPVESFIAPDDLIFKHGMYGPQVVRKGSWVLGIKIEDPAEWARVKSGEYTGISIGGWGARVPIKKKAFNEVEHPRDEQGRFGSGSASKTASGKQIHGAGAEPYAAARAAKSAKGRAAAVAENHPKFTPKDHLDAYKAHLGAAKKTNNAKERALHDNLAKAHADVIFAAAAKAKAAQAKKAPKEKPKKTGAPTPTGGANEADAIAHKSLNTGQKSALTRYQSEDYAGLQGYLRTGTVSPGSSGSSKGYENQAKNLDRGIRSNKVTKPLTVYRGIGATGEMANLRPGHEFTDKGFVSTSAKSSVATDFAKGYGKSHGSNKGKPVVFSIGLKPGQSALSVAHHSNDSEHAAEREVLLPRNSRFRVQSVKHVGGVQHVHLEVI